MDKPKLSQKVGLVQFFALCEVMKTHREVITRDCHNKVELAQWLTAKMGFECPIGTAEKALEATNIPLEKAKKPARDDKREIARHRLRIITRAIVRLYKKLGEEVDSDMMALHKFLSNGEGIDPSKKIAEPVPVSSVPDSKTIPVVNK